MNKYLEISIAVKEPWQSEILVAQLSEIGFEGFEEEIKLLKAYIPKASWNADWFNEIISQLQVHYTIRELENKNWNAEWEANFHPVIVGKFCAIRASFHPTITTVQHEIIITPKMSFGTGHHATTYMMIQAMQHLEYENKTVFDFGTGTGVLAILAHQLGVAHITAIDNDDWSIENASENFTQNNCGSIELIKATSFPNQFYDIVLANINRNVILEQMNAIEQHLTKNGVVMFSGLLKTDEETVVKKAGLNNLKLARKWEREDWICLKMRKLE
jgi:ribosomal protein L11 methyltransferase